MAPAECFPLTGSQLDPGTYERPEHCSPNIPQLLFTPLFLNNLLCSPNHLYQQKFT